DLHSANILSQSKRAVSVAGPRTKTERQREETYGVRYLATALIRRQLAVAHDTLNGKATVICRKEITTASYRKEIVAASCRIP
ncbi:MAG: hypothetical protein ACUVQH_07960, partial [Thermogutta sp.]